MRPIAATKVTSLAAPIERVFEVLTDPTRMARWLPDVAAVEASGPLKRGAQARVRYGERTIVLEIVDHKAPYTFGWIEREGRRGVKTFFRLDWAGGSTAVTVRDIWTPPSLKAWFKAKLTGKRRPDAQAERILQGLRVVVAES
jgi:uncharacterized protein YndB with AHSA1/START domain